MALFKKDTINKNDFITESKNVELEDNFDDIEFIDFDDDTDNVEDVIFESAVETSPLTSSPLTSNVVESSGFNNTISESVQKRLNKRQEQYSNTSDLGVSFDTESNFVSKEIDMTSSLSAGLDQYDWDSKKESDYSMSESFIPDEDDEEDYYETNIKNTTTQPILRKSNKSDFSIGTLTRDNYGPLLTYIENPDITDINWNGKQLWLDDVNKGRYEVNTILDKEFVDAFSIRVSNVVSKQFNKYVPVLEAEAENLRITVIHESVSHTGRSISIRKTPAIKRITFQNAVRSGNFCSETVANLISNAVKAKMNIIVCGLPGAGKTEFIKYLTNYIFPKDRAITIEDTLELHYNQINPGKDCIEFKVDQNFTYTDAIKASLRLLPQWILLSEARSTEVRYLLESVSTGTKCLTTLHTDDVRKIPSRVVNMIGEQTNQEDILNSVHEFFNMGILIDKTVDETGIERFISQICFFTRENNENKCVMVVDDKELVNTELPKEIKRLFKRLGIKNPFEYTFIKA